MEAVMLPSSTPDQSISPYKQKRSPRKNNKHVFISRPYENFAPFPNHLYNINGSLFFRSPPASLSSSFSSSIPSFMNRQQQPPLLPLPISQSAQYIRGGGGLLSPPQTNRKANSRIIHQDLTPKKPKSSKSPKKQNFTKYDSRAISKSLAIPSTNRSGPDPIDLPKEVSRVFKPVEVSSATVDNARQDVDLCGSISSLGPPPSCLPLPKFSLKPKLSCNVEAGGGIDAGATDGLRRILRLQ